MAKVTDEGGNLDFVRHVYAVRLDVPRGRDYEALVLVPLMLVYVVFLPVLFFGVNVHVKVARYDFVFSRWFCGCILRLRGATDQVSTAAAQDAAAAATWLAMRPAKA